MAPETLLRRIRLAVGIFIAGLVASGITAFPLLTEVELLTRMLGVDAVGNTAPANGGLHFWIYTVREGLRATSRDYPFLFYGTDWLAFGHLVIALFFVPVLREPVRYRANVLCGLAACVGVMPVAFIGGAIRGIPLSWQLIDCSFGVGGFAVLIYALRLIDRLPSTDSDQAAPREIL
jgi:hypothetical protein